MFSRLIRRLSCKQLKSLLKKNGRRLVAAQSGPFSGWLRSKLINSLKAKRKMIQARIRVKCVPSSGSTSLAAKLKACKAKAKKLYPIKWYWNPVKNALQIKKRKAYIRKCMGGSSGFDGGYSNMPGPLGSGLPIPAVGITSPPNPIHTIPGQPYTSIGRPNTSLEATRFVLSLAY